jgi:hypothetical protein
VVDPRQGEQHLLGIELLVELDDLLLEVSQALLFPFALVQLPVHLLLEEGGIEGPLAGVSDGLVEGDRLLAGLKDRLQDGRAEG